MNITVSQPRIEVSISAAEILEIYKNRPDTVFLCHAIYTYVKAHASLKPEYQYAESISRLPSEFLYFELINEERGYGKSDRVHPNNRMSPQVMRWICSNMGIDVVINEDRNSITKLPGYCAMDGRSARREILNALIEKNAPNLELSIINI